MFILEYNTYTTKVVLPCFLFTPGFQKICVVRFLFHEKKLPQVARRIVDVDQHGIGLSVCPFPVRRPEVTGIN